MSLSKLVVTELKRHSGYWSLALAVVISIVVFYFRDYLVNLKTYGYVGLFFISILGNATIILPVPVILTAFIGGGIFNPLLVGIVVSLGAAIGELTGYLAGYGGRGFVKSKKVEKMEVWMKKYGLWTLFVLSAIPNPAFDLAGIVAGASKVPVYKYLVIVWLGKLIKFLAISYLGAGSLTLIDRILQFSTK